MMRNTSFLTGLAIFFSLSTGCATISRGDKQKVTFATKPPAAKLVVDGNAYTTPDHALRVQRQAARKGRLRRRRREGPSLQGKQEKGQRHDQAQQVTSRL